MAKVELVNIGRITRPHGIKGEVCVHCYADVPFLLERVDALYLVPEKGGRRRKVSVRSWRNHKGGLLAAFEHVRDRNQAEEMRGLMLAIAAKDLPPLEDDEVYLRELLGLEVALPDGSRLGKIEDILTPTPEQEIWSVRTDEGREILLPATGEFVVEIDLEQGRVTVDPPPGLLDICVSS